MTDAATRARDAELLAEFVRDVHVRGEDGAELVRSLAADAARLDWLDAQRWHVVQILPDYRGLMWRLEVEDDGTPVTLRDAIDAAMASANARALADAFPVPDVTPDAGVGE